MMAVSGPRAGERLKVLPTVLTRWSVWRRQHPDTKVLSRDTGYGREYKYNPYAAYFRDRQRLMFLVRPLDDRRGLKDRVLGVSVGNHYKAYVERDLARQPEVIDELSGRRFTIRYDRSTRTIKAVDPPQEVATLYTFWFAWAAMHPETDVFEPSNGSQPLQASVRGPGGG